MMHYHAAIQRVHMPCLTRQSSHVERVVLSVESLQVLQQASTSETGGGATLRQGVGATTSLFISVSERS